MLEALRLEQRQRLFYAILQSPFYRAAIPANTPIAPRAKPANVALAAAPVEVLEPVAAELAAEAVAEEEPEDAALFVASVVDWFALPALVRAWAVTPVLFWQSALYWAAVKGVEVKVMSAHCKHCQQFDYTLGHLENILRCRDRHWGHRW